MAKGEVTYVVKVIDKGNGIYQVTEKLEKMDKAGKKAESSVAKLDKQLTKFLKGGMVATSVALIGRELYNQGSAAVKAAGQMERYNATLETMLGSKSAARDRLEEYMRIAKVTPFEMTEVVEAGNKLQALGRYSEDTLLMLGDLAAASGKPLEQAMNAYSKMASGQKGIAVDMFRDLLITTDDWAKATGKGVKSSGEMVASANELLDVLPKILKNKGFFGLMAKQAETTEGKIANFQDSIFSLRAAIGERLAPTVRKTLDVTGKWVNSLENAIKIPVEQKIAKEKVELNYLVENLIKANDNEEERNKWIAELQSKYPEFLKNVNLEKDGLEGIRSKLSEVNEEYENKIKLAIYEKKRTKLEEQYQDVQSDILQKQINQAAKSEINSLRAKAFASNKGLSSRAERENISDKEIMRYLSETDKAIYQANLDRISLRSEFQSNSSLQKRAATYLAGLQILNDEINNLQIDSSSTTTNDGTATTTNDGTATNGGGGGTTSGTATAKGSTLGSGGGSGRGGGAVVNITNLVNKIEIHTVNMKESVAEIKKIVTQALVEATAEIA